MATRIIDEKIMVRVIFQEKKSPIFKSLELPGSMSVAQALTQICKELAIPRPKHDKAHKDKDAHFFFSVTCQRTAQELADPSKPLHHFGIQAHDILEIKHRTKEDMKLRDKLSRKSSSRQLTSTSSVRQILTYVKDSQDAQQLFGKPLWRVIEKERDLDRHEKVPFVVEAICDIIRAKHLKEAGIFRVSGQTDVVQGLRNKLGTMFMRGRFDISVLVAEDPHALANVVKQFFRELPEPLIPFDQYHATVALAKVKDEAERAAQIRVILTRLPFEKYAVLRYLIEFLTDIHAFAPINQMTSSNLSIIFGPALLHPAAEKMASPEYLNAMGDVNLVVDTMIAHADFIFDIGLPVSLRRDEDDKKPSTANDAAVRTDSKPIRVCETCHKRRAKHIVAMKNERARQRSAQKKKSDPPAAAIRTRSVTDLATGGNSNGATDLRTTSSSPAVRRRGSTTPAPVDTDAEAEARRRQAAVEKEALQRDLLTQQAQLKQLIRKSSARSVLAASADSGAAASAESSSAVASSGSAGSEGSASGGGGLGSSTASAVVCDLCHTELAKFRLTLRSGKQLKSCAPCMKARQERQRAKKAAAGQRGLSQSDNSLHSPREQPPAPSDPPPPPHENPPPPPSEDNPPPPPLDDPQFDFDNPPPPPVDEADDEEADDDAMSAWREQSARRQRRLDVARSRIFLAPVVPPLEE